MKGHVRQAVGLFLLMAAGGFWVGFWWYLGQDTARALVILLIDVAHR